MILRSQVPEDLSRFGASLVRFVHVGGAVCHQPDWGGADGSDLSGPLADLFGGELQAFPEQTPDRSHQRTSLLFCPPARPVTPHAAPPGAPPPCGAGSWAGARPARAKEERRAAEEGGSPTARSPPYPHRPPSRPPTQSPLATSVAMPR